MTVVVKLGSTLVVDSSGPCSTFAARRARRRGRRAGARRRTGRASSRRARSRSACRGSALTRRPSATPQAPGRLGGGPGLGFRRHGTPRCARQGLEAAQILLSAPDLAERASYVNVRNAFETLLKLGVVPVVNENDATATDEITFGDNDALAAQVAVLTRARLLVLLTEVDGVYATHPAESRARSCWLRAPPPQTPRSVNGSTLGRGGMASKIAAARLAAAAGIPSVIASGRGRDVVGPIVAGRSVAARTCRRGCRRQQRVQALAPLRETRASGASSSTRGAERPGRARPQPPGRRRCSL